MKVFILAHQTARERAIEAVRTAPDGFQVTISEARRNLRQNARLWACLGDVAKQVPWHGLWLSAEDWKHIFSAYLKKQRSVPNLEGTGFVVLGQSTSKMTKQEMSDMLHLIEAFGVEKGVIFYDQ